MCSTFGILNGSYTYCVWDNWIYCLSYISWAALIGGHGVYFLFSIHWEISYSGVLASVLFLCIMSCGCRMRKVGLRFICPKEQFLLFCGVWQAGFVFHGARLMWGDVPFSLSCTGWVESEIFGWISVDFYILSKKGNFRSGNCFGSRFACACSLSYTIISAFLSLTFPASRACIISYSFIFFCCVYFISF